MHHLKVLKDYLLDIDGSSNITLQGGNTMQVTPVICKGSVLGVNVNTLGNQPFLSIDVFVSTISLLSTNIGHKAIKGNAMKGTLGDVFLPFNSIEGHVAKVVYGNLSGSTVFRRITPISKILEIAGVCLNGRGFLKLI